MNKTYAKIVDRWDDEKKEKLGIKTSTSSRYNNLVLFKYNMIKCDFSKPFIRDCRGTILDRDNGYAPVCTPFTKFFNYGEELAVGIDWYSARVQEKLDGSLLNLYNYDNAWRVATSGNPDADSDVHGWGITFEQLFWKTFNDMNFDLPNNKNLTFMFELTSPYNKIVVNYSAPKLHLIGVRDRRSGYEFDVRDFPYYNPVRHFDLRSIDDINRTLPDLDPKTQEGYVVVDKNFDRIKIKSPLYVKLHHLKGDGFNKKKMLNIIRESESAEFLSYFPEHREEFNKLSLAYDNIIKSTEAIFDDLKHIEGDKDFAICAKQTVVPHALFALRRSKANSAEEFFRNMRVENLLNMIGR